MAKSKFKRKERELTPEEAVALAIQENKPHWFGQSPLFSAVASETGHLLFPLDPSLNKEIWGLVFLNPQSIVGSRGLEILFEWQRRYSSIGVRFLIVYCPRYEFQKQIPYIKSMMDSFSTQVPLVIDHLGATQKALHITDLNTLVFLEKSQVIFRGNITDELESSELFLQGHLRKKDPGLPLLRPFKPSTPLLKYAQRIELATPEFLKKYPAWTLQGDGVLTQDPKSVVQFDFNGTFIHILAEGLLKTIEAPRLYIEINGLPIPEEFASSAIFRDDAGQTYLEPRAPGLYAIVQNLPDSKGSLTLKFPNAGQINIKLFVIVVSKPV